MRFHNFIEVLEITAAEICINNGSLRKAAPCIVKYSALLEALEAGAFCCVACCRMLAGCEIIFPTIICIKVSMCCPQPEF